MIKIEKLRKTFKGNRKKRCWNKTLGTCLSWIEMHHPTPPHLSPAPCFHDPLFPSPCPPPSSAFCVISVLCNLCKVKNKTIPRSNWPAEASDADQTAGVTRLTDYVWRGMQYAFLEMLRILKFLGLKWHRIQRTIFENVKLPKFFDV